MVEVLFFAACRACTDTDSAALPLAGQTVERALAVLVERYPDLARVLPHCRFAVAQSFGDKDHVLRDGDELALIPPVGGGQQEPPRVRARVIDTPLSVDAVLARVGHPGAGAEVVMIGCVRDRAAGQTVERLKYEAYVPMAEKVIADIIVAIEAEIEGVRGAVDHRIGMLDIGERAVVVAASAPHRAEAFAACRAIIDRLKDDAPIWKHEHRQGGVVWVGLGP